MEIWKDIQGYEGLYQVSNLGNVRSLNWRNLGYAKNLYLKKQNKGYLQVELAKNGIKKMFTVHRIVATHFVDGYAEGLVVNHINEDKKDNRAENLEWCTFSQNVHHSMNMHRNESNRYHQKGIPYKRTEKIDQFTANGEFVRTWESAIAIKSELGYSQWSITECCKGNRRTAYGYKWQFAT